MTTPDIPLLDIALWRDGAARQRERLASRMDQALQESGFPAIPAQRHKLSARSDRRQPPDEKEQRW